ncbi:hypothetical protein [Legionella brunensis]|uniref:Coiled-coil protein n=1 Tax=Legionella brunensis TaxID=29422 RepID=A0A0W0S0N1_9GAMM|nr:hypothetical protein [Legionella brunensis]KTC76891.1 coiled-coil protein [Legionella brunensis]
MHDQSKQPLQAQENEMASIGDEEELSEEKFLIRVRGLQRKVKFTGRPLPEKALVLLLLKKLPLLSNFLHSVDGAGNALSKLAMIRGYAGHTVETASKGFQWANLGLALIDFFRIPLIYLAAAMIGEKPPITLSKNARWLYSTVLLVLTIVSLAVPAAAPAIALATAVLGLAVSTFLLAKHLIERHRIKVELENLKTDIKTQEEELQAIQEQAKMLQEIIEKNQGEFTLQELGEKLRNLESSFDIKKEEIQKLYDRQTHLNQKLAKMDLGSIVDKTAAIAISAVVLIGFAVALAFPFVGLGILAAGAALGGAYILARLSYPYIKSFAEWATKKIKKEESPVEIEMDEKLNSEHAKTELQSTALTLLKLQPEDEVISTIIRHHESPSLCDHYEQIDIKVHELVQKKDLQGMLDLFRELASYAKKHGTSLEELQSFLAREEMKSCLSLLPQAVKQISILDQDREQLLCYPPLIATLQDKSVDLTQVAAKKINIPKPSLQKDEGMEEVGSQSHNLTHSTH